MKESDSLIDFPKVKERLNQRPPQQVYKNHFKRNFIKHVGQSALKCSKCGDSQHFENACPKVWRPIRKDFVKTAYSNSQGPKQIWVPKKT